MNANVAVLVCLYVITSSARTHTNRYLSIFARTAYTHNQRMYILCRVESDLHFCACVSVLYAENTEKKRNTHTNKHSPESPFL